MPDEPSDLITDTGPFVIIPEWVVDLGLSHQAFRLYAVLASYADWKDGSSWPSRKTLATRLNTSTDSIDRWLKDLVETKCLTVVKRTDPENPSRNLSNLYYLHRLAPTRKTAPTPTRNDTATPTRNDTALTIPNLERDPLEHSLVIKQVFATWLDSTGKQPARTKLDNTRLTRIRWAISNYPQQDVLDAVQGWKHSPFHAGDNRQKAVFNDLTLILRNAEKLEYFRDCYRKNQPTITTPKSDWKPCGECWNGWIEVDQQTLAPCKCRKVIV